MKKRKRVTKGRKIGRKIKRLMASAEDRKLPLAIDPALLGLYRPIKKPVTIRVDADVLAWFQKQGRGYQTRINRALRQVVMAERKKSRK